MYRLYVGIINRMIIGIYRISSISNIQQLFYNFIYYRRTSWSAWGQASAFQGRILGFHLSVIQEIHGDPGDPHDPWGENLGWTTNYSEKISSPDHHWIMKLLSTYQVKKNKERSLYTPSVIFSYAISDMIWPRQLLQRRHLSNPARLCHLIPICYPSTPGYHWLWKVFLAAKKNTESSRN